MCVSLTPYNRDFCLVGLEEPHHDVSAPALVVAQVVGGELSEQQGGADLLERVLGGRAGVEGARKFTVLFVYYV